MDRLISEKEVLKAFEKYLRFEGNFHEMIKAIPSTEPTKDLLIQIIRDILAMYVVDENGNQLSRDEVKCGAINIVKKYLRQLPSAEPKIGYREYNDIYDHYLCGNCKTVVMDYDNFCPNCGRKMFKTGSWLFYGRLLKCSNCGYINDDILDECPNCKISMVEPQESEDKA